MANNDNLDEALALDEHHDAVDEQEEEDEDEHGVLLRSDSEDDDDDDDESLPAQEPWYEFVNRDANHLDESVSSGEEWVSDDDDDDSDDTLSFGSDETQEPWYVSINSDANHLDASVSSGEEWVSDDNDDGSDDALSFDSDETEDCNEILPLESPPVRLDWRMNPQESFSDFSITVVPHNGKQSTVYHVHKLILALLSRERSDYFYKLVAAGGFAEHETSSCTIRLEHEKLAEAFPVLLDYMYGINDAPCFTSENVAALHNLGRYFGLARLCKSAEDYWDSDISFQNYAAYYSDGTKFSSTGIVKVVKRICIQNIMNITPDSRILEICDSQFLLDVLEAVVPVDWALKYDPNSNWFDQITEDHKILSVHLSLLVTGFCKHHKLHSDALKPHQFIALADWDFLPVVDHTAAIDLLQLENEIGGDIAADDSLKARCIDALARNWKNIPALSVQALLDAMDPNLLSSLNRARNKAKAWNVECTIS